MTKSTNIQSFMKGVFWTTYIGMMVFIALTHAPMSQLDKEEGYTAASSEQIKQAIRLSMEEVR